MATAVTNEEPAKHNIDMSIGCRATCILPSTSIDVKSFYQRELPSHCIDFTSDTGKKLFREGISDKYMESYFSVAAKFHTQMEPAFCGLGTLTTVLNALNVDPGRIWKGPWRWFGEEMLDCCKSLEDIKVSGLTLAEVVCLGDCNGLTTNLRYASESSVDEFRDFIRSTTQSKDHILIVSYDRSVLGQTGTGHFSPIGGYHEALDFVLIMDVARFKYPPHWVSVDLLFKAMLSIDPVSKLSRGFVDCSKK